MVMTQTAVPPRNQIAREHTWNAESVYATSEAWAAELKAVADDLPMLAAFQQHLGDSAQKLADWLETSEKVSRQVGKLLFYARMSQAVETTNQAAVSMVGQAAAVAGQFAAATAFGQPEILVLGEGKVMGWVQSEPRLKIYAHYFSDLFRQQQHVRSA